MLIILSFIIFLLFSCSVHTKTSTKEDVLSCTPTLDEKAIRPTVCGRCEIRLKDGKLYIEEARDCPRYEVYRCTRSDGKSFYINNLNCQPFDR
ncbi:MAG: hypothetical protein D6674_06910 [Acidobacteria bacterium]|nr:MAG: hypothetical protein D6674_06910 [Acidobacteriota bacterium]